MGFHITDQMVCAFGAGTVKHHGGTGKRCGVITGLSFGNKTCKGAGQGQGAGPCATLEITVEVSFDSTGGDSGGPYWEGGSGNTSPWRAVGMHTHSMDDGTANAHGWYVPISRQLAALDAKVIIVRLCTDAACNVP